VVHLVLDSVASIVGIFRVKRGAPLFGDFHQGHFHVDRSLFPKEVNLALESIVLLQLVPELVVIDVAASHTLPDGVLTAAAQTYSSPFSRLSVLQLLLAQVLNQRHGWHLPAR